MTDARAELTARPQWVAWRFEERDGDLTKVPYSPTTGRRASSTDPRTWGNYADAVAFAERTGAAGVGYMLGAGDPYVGIDLDKCRDTDTGETEAWALDALRQLATYSEVSPSGRGYHVWARGTLPPGGRKRGQVEMYDRERYLTVTWRHVEGTPPTIEDRQEAITAFHAAVFAQREVAPPAGAPEARPVDASDQTILDAAQRASNGPAFAALWAGDAGEYGGDRSAADLALVNHLAFYCGQDEARIDALFRQSGLYRTKWDRRHYSNGETYGQHTIRKALADLTDVWEGPALEVDASRPRTNGAHTNGAANGSGENGVELIDAAALMGKDFPIPRYAVPDLLPEGLSILSGKPKQGKSWLGLGFALAVASGTPALGQFDVQAGDVLYLALEDGQRRLQRRLTELLGDDPPPPRLTFATKWPSADDGGVAVLRGWLEMHPAARLVVIDTFTRFRPEEKRGQGVYAQDYKAVAPLADLAHEFSVSIVIVLHNRKMASDDAMDLVSGSLGLSGAGDGVLVMMRERGSADAVLHVFDRDQEDKTVALRWNVGNGGWLYLGDAEQYRRSKQRNEVLAALHDFGPSGPRDLAERMGKNRGTINRLLWELRQSGEATNAGGTYMPLAPRPDGIPSFVHMGEEGEEGEAPDTTGRRAGEEQAKRAKNA